MTKILKPGKAFRFAVGNRSGRRSSTWLVVTKKNSRDVYLAVQSISSLMKVSLHESGVWRSAWLTAENAAPYIDATKQPFTDPRLLDKWSKPAPFAPGWTRGYQVRVHESDLAKNRAAEQGAITFAPTPSPGKGMFIEVLLGEPHAPLLNIANAVTLGELRGSDESQVHVFAHEVDLAPEHLASADALRPRMTKEALEALPRSARCLVHGNDEVGNRFGIEFALRPGVKQ